ncbi:MAG TPA: cation:proton antiporter, partial [Actinomycetes bacterium]|nr:cation:proton antiporter [Actinomycetes bacterium]
MPGRILGRGHEPVGATDHRGAAARLRGGVGAAAVHRGHSGDGLCRPGSAGRQPRPGPGRRGRRQPVRAPSGRGHPGPGVVHRRRTGQAGHTAARVGPAGPGSRASGSWPSSGAGTLAGLVLFPQLDLWTAAALATILAPTDAALGLPVVTNQRLPSRIRQGLNVESGLNDGVCVPLLIIFLTIAQAEEGVGHIEPLKVVAEEIGFGVVGGVAAGALGAWVLGVFARRGWMEGTWQQINAVATPLLAYTVAAALGGSGFIAAFTAGIVFGAVAGERAEHSTFLAEQSGELLNAVTFLLFGAVLLGPALGELDWR